MKVYLVIVVASIISTKYIGDIIEVSVVKMAKAVQSNKSQSDTIAYVNELKCKLLIYEKSESGFKYKLSNKCQKGACEGLDDMEGEATLDSPNSNLSEDPKYSEPGMVNFNFLEDGNALMVELDPIIIGYDCAGSYASNYKLVK